MIYLYINFIAEKTRLINIRRKDESNHGSAFDVVELHVQLQGDQASVFGAHFNSLPIAFLDDIGIHILSPQSLLFQEFLLGASDVFLLGDGNGLTSGYTVYFNASEVVMILSILPRQPYLSLDA